MPNINGQELFDAKVSAFGASSNSDAWNSAYMLSLKMVCADLRILCHLSITTPISHQAEIDVDSDYYLPVVNAGMDYYLDQHGDWMRKPEGDLKAAYRDAKRNANLYYMRDVNDTDEARLGDLTD